MSPQYTNSESFKKNGFVIIPGVLSTDELGAVRALLHEVIGKAPAEKRMLTIGDLLKDESLLRALTQVQFNKRLLEILRSIIGKQVCYINNLNLQCNMYGIGVGGGWHTDCASEVDNTNLYLYEPSYLFGKVGVYFQDNTLEFGGGISVIKLSHKIFTQFSPAKNLSPIFSRLRGRIKLGSVDSYERKEFRVPIKAGSALYFDSRLIHRSSPPLSLALNDQQKAAQRLQNELMGEKYAKYVVYWEACAREYAAGFLRNSCKRAITEEIGLEQPSRERFFSEYLSYSFPHDYPQSYVDLCDLHQVTIATPTQRIANFWKTARDL